MFGTLDFLAISTVIFASAPPTYTCHLRYTPRTLHQEQDFHYCWFPYCCQFLGILFWYSCIHLNPHVSRWIRVSPQYMWIELREYENIQTRSEVQDILCAISYVCVTSILYLTLNSKFFFNTRLHWELAQHSTSHKIFCALHDHTNFWTNPRREPSHVCCLLTSPIRYPWLFAIFVSFPCILYLSSFEMSIWNAK